MLSRLAKLLAIVAAVQILGGHWMALQSVAWVGMVIDYSKQAPLTVALEKTFDGAHPCHLCETVSKGRSDEKKNESEKLVLKFEAVLGTTFAMIAPVGHPWFFAGFNETPAAVASAPPTPPPLA